ncbi:MAG: glycosyltransferase [Anderseniella sp.]|jgi:predicted glycosyltransferase|nr:glycosyltransferase [Anderseniella sp.]
MKVMFYVQHLLGIGHLVRASRIASALVEAGHDVVMVSGGLPVAGFPPAGVALEQLIPLRSADSSFSSLADEHGAAVDDAMREQRRHQLLATYDRISPDCLIIEAFPFARRQMRFELLPLLEHVHAQPSSRRALVVSSVRDIVQPKSRERDKATAKLVARYFDLVLVHGDERFARFSDTFSEAGAVADRLAYTGMVAPAPPAADTGSSRRYDVVVSAGGGAVGAALLDAAIGARPLTRLAAGRWLVVTGPNLPENVFARLQAAQSDGLTLSRFEPGLAAVIASARLSVSQAGYNTVADMLSGSAAGVLVPFEGAGEREQLVRAQRLAALGRVAVVRECQLDASSLAAAIEAALDLDHPDDFPVNLDGARNSARLVEEHLAAFRAGQAS